MWHGSTTLTSQAETMWSEHVSGEMPTIVRRQKLQRLKAVGEDEIGLLSAMRVVYQKASMFQPLTVWRLSMPGAVRSTSFKPSEGRYALAPRRKWAPSSFLSSLSKAMIQKKRLNRAISSQSGKY